MDFMRIDSEEKAYWLGFLLADGNLSKNGCKVSLSLKKEDRPHLEKFARLFNVQIKPLQRVDVCNVCKKFVWQSLFHQGLRPNKTWKDPIKIFKNIPQNSMRHFIRGIFDGDGSVFFTKVQMRNGKENQNLKISFIGNVFTMQYIQNEIKSALSLKGGSFIKHSKSQAYELRYGGNKQAPKILNWMYANSKVYLERKGDFYGRRS
jgi:hypothetical protein